MTANRAVAAILIASLAGCSSAPQHGAVNFYPANPEANTIGILTGEYQTVGPGAGSLRAVMPDGEVLTGQFAIIQAGASGLDRSMPPRSRLSRSPASCTAEAVRPSARALVRPACSAITVPRCSANFTMTMSSITVMAAADRRVGRFSAYNPRRRHGPNASLPTRVIVLPEDDPCGKSEL